MASSSAAQAAGAEASHQGLEQLQVLLNSLQLVHVMRIGSLLTAMLWPALNSQEISLS